MEILCVNEKENPTEYNKHKILEYNINYAKEVTRCFTAGIQSKKEKLNSNKDKLELTNIYNKCTELLILITTSFIKLKNLKLSSFMKIKKRITSLIKK